MKRGKQHVDEELLIRFVVGETTGEEAEKVEQWIRYSQENAARIEMLKKVWAATQDQTKIEPAAVDTEAAWNQLKSRIDEYGQIESKYLQKERNLLYYMVRVAAVFLVGILIFSIYKYLAVEGQEVQLVSTDSTINDQPLPDGSMISLNQNSVVEYQKEFSETERKVKMSGEAFFKVQPDPERPFIVEAQDAIITVVGTSFNVKALQNDAAVEVMVEQGLVELANQDKSQSTLLRIGEKGIFLKETSEVKKETDIDVESLYWLNKTLLFRKTRLSVVFSTLEKLYDIEITVENKQILNCELTAKFSNETIDNILQHISTIFDLTTEKKARIITIKGDGCQ